MAESRHDDEAAAAPDSHTWSAAVDNSTDLVVIADASGSLRYLNRSAVAWFAPSGATAPAGVRDLYAASHRAQFDDEILTAVLRDGYWQGDTVLALADDSLAPVAQVVEALFGEDGELVELTIVSRDLRERFAFDAELAFQALHDPLTGLPNRALFLERLGDALDRAGQAPESVAVMFLDVDNFKYVNDSLGHDAGDRLLIAIARRIESQLRTTDTVGRFGGDEFTIVCEHLRGPEDALEVARRIVMAVAQPFLLSEGEVYVTASVGVTVPRRPHDRPDELLRDANVALYQAKQRGKSRVDLFDEPMRTRSQERLALDKDLRRALADWQYRVYYQPQVRLDTGTIVGFEALLRWEHPERGLVGPDEFIAIAEETGLIVPIGAWVLAESCRQLAEWRDSIPNSPSVQMSVNISGRQLAYPDLVDQVAYVLQQHRLDARQLCLEITESVLLDDSDLAIGVLESLRDLGVALSVDDFGTGYSSLGYLKRLPIDCVKVDQSFVDGLGHDVDDSTIVHAVVSMAHALGLAVVAEGVETTDQLFALEELGCDFAQGFYFAQPQPAAVVTALLRRPLHWRHHGRPRLVG